MLVSVSVHRIALADDVWCYGHACVVRNTTGPWAVGESLDVHALPLYNSRCVEEGSSTLFGRPQQQQAVL